MKTKTIIYKLLFILSSFSLKAQNSLEITLDSKPESNGVLAYANFEFSASNAKYFQCKVDDESFEVCTSPKMYLSLPEGIHQFSVKAIDENDNSGEILDYNWAILNIFDEPNADILTSSVTPDFVAPNGWRGIFRINCDFSHSSYNDPIVFPNQQNRAHLHRFYGNTIIDHSTTTESLVSQGESTCQGNKVNLSSYWVPALLAPHYISGQRVIDDLGEPAWIPVPAVVGDGEDVHEIFYYSASVDDLESIQPLPVGLKMIAGNHMSVLGQEQDTSIVRWHCQSWVSNDFGNPDFSASIPECSAPDRVRLDIFFPSCWNGVDLDSADHKSHMAYPINSGSTQGVVCPDTHPVPVVRPSYHYAFGVKPEVYDPISQSSKGWRLASDMYEVEDNNPGGFSLHGDWFNAWHPAVMQAILDYCIKGEFDCHDGNLANGYRLSSTQAGTQVEPDVINSGIGTGKAENFTINSGLNGAWYNTYTSGQGMLIETLPESQRAFLTWFTYDTELEASGSKANIGALGQRWFTGLGDYDQSNNSIEFDISLTTGGIFDDEKDVSYSAPNSIGTVTFNFNDCATGTVDYEFFNELLTGSFNIGRISSENDSLCDEINNISDDNIESEFTINSGVNGAWYNPITSGQGLMLEVLPKTKRAFFAWFTYENAVDLAADEAIIGSNKHRWLTGIGDIDPITNSVSFDISVTSGGLFDNNRDITTSSANSYGRLTINFSDCAHAIVSYEIFGLSISNTFAVNRISTENDKLCKQLN
jgi:hypothetical protein